MDQRVTCCIAGGGPAGMMLGVLLARAGVKVTVLEKHKDFLRDFRGDTIHPSTLRMMEELGWLQDFLKLPHQEATRIYAQFGDTRVEMANFSHLPITTKFIALMPQWDFLDFLADKGRAYPNFDLRMNAEATGLVFDGDRVSGVKVKTPEGPLTINADLVVAADGRSSVLRDAAGFVSEKLRRANGRDVVPAAEASDRYGRDTGPLRYGPYLRHAPARRLLAVRLRHPERRRRRGSGCGT